DARWRCKPPAVFSSARPCPKRYSAPAVSVWTNLSLKPAGIPARNPYHTGLASGAWKLDDE
ncbi:hypothetical protein K5M56_17940, partial [Serratia marcescens]|nr:hypothetical protein [Serratia marcescens]